MLLCAHGCTCLWRAEEGVGSPGTGGTGGFGLPDIGAGKQTLVL